MRLSVSLCLQELIHSGHSAMFPAICRLADYLDDHGADIDYTRRRALVDPTELLTDTEWRKLCGHTSTHSGQGTSRLLHARRYLYQLLTGTPPEPRSPRLGFSSPTIESPIDHANRCQPPTCRLPDGLARRCLPACDRLG